MKELNKKTLRDALDRLPAHRPPPGDWDALDRRLSAATPLRDAIERLPVYDPPERVWTGIEKSLRPPTRRLGWRQWGSVAAAILLLATATLWWLDRAPTGGESTISSELRYTVETVDNRLLAQVPTDEDEAYFEQLLQLCTVQPIECKRPAVQSLQQELAELSEARDALQTAIGAYGADTDLLAQLKEIELDRTRVAQALLEAVV